MDREDALESALAAILQWSRAAPEQRREEELIRERMEAWAESDPEPYSPTEPTPPPMLELVPDEEYAPAPGDEDAWDAWEAFQQSPEGRELNRQRFEWRRREAERMEAIRRQVRGELRTQMGPQRRPPPMPRPLPVLRVARPREHGGRPTRRRVAVRGSPRGPSDPDLADPPGLVGALLALARAS
jgi:hypothetical protein